MVKSIREKEKRDRFNLRQETRIRIVHVFDRLTVRGFHRILFHLGFRTTAKGKI